MTEALRILGCWLLIEASGAAIQWATGFTLLQKARLRNKPSFESRALRGLIDVANVIGVILLGQVTLIIGFWILSGRLMIRILLPATLALLVIEIGVRLLSAALTAGSADARFRLQFHHLLLPAVPPAVTHRRNLNLVLVVIPINLAFISLAALVKPTWLSSDAGQLPIMAVLFFFVFLVANRLPLLIIQKPLLSDPHAEDGVRIAVLLTTFLPQILISPLLLFCLDYLYFPGLFAMHIGGVQVWILILAVTIAVLGMQLIYLYQGSSGFVSEQQKLSLKKRTFLNRISQIPLASSDGRSKLIDRLIMEIGAEVATICRDDLRVRRIAAEYLRERLDELDWSDAEQEKTGIPLFGLQQDELAAWQKPLSVEEKKKIDAAVNANKLKQYMMHAQLPTIVALRSLDSTLEEIVSDWVRARRNWNLKFWYSFDMIDYLLFLRSRNVDFTLAAAARAPDLEQIPPRNVGKAVVTLLFSLLSVILGHLSSSANDRGALISWITGLSNWFGPPFSS